MKDPEDTVIGLMLTGLVVIGILFALAQAVTSFPWLVVGMTVVAVFAVVVGTAVQQQWGER